MPAAAIPIIIGAAATTAGTVYGAKRQADAAEKAAGMQAQGSEQALDFSKVQAAAAARQAEIDRRANYDQWAARDQRMGRLGEAVGLAPRRTPGYVPGMTDPAATLGLTGQQRLQIDRGFAQPDDRLRPSAYFGRTADLVRR